MCKDERIGIIRTQEIRKVSLEEIVTPVLSKFVSLTSSVAFLLSSHSVSLFHFCPFIYFIPLFLSFSFLFIFFSPFFLPLFFSFIAFFYLLLSILLFQLIYRSTHLFFFLIFFPVLSFLLQYFLTSFAVGSDLMNVILEEGDILWLSSQWHFLFSVYILVS